MVANRRNNKLIVILGPTSSGKTGLSIKLAKKFDGEVVSADSRQVYKGMDIGSGKVTKKEMQGIPHHLLDVANPKTRFSIAQYQKLALSVIKKIQNKNKIPFLVGGTGFYIQSIVDGIVIPEVKPDWKLREKLGKKPLSELFRRLQELDPIRAGGIDQNNPRRVIRALEVAIKLKGPVPSSSSKKPDFDALLLGVKKTPEELKNLIYKRLIKRLENNAIINEVKKLHKSLSWKRLKEFGLEYRFVAQYLQGKITHQQMLENIEKESWHLVKKQMTWFKRDKRIRWIKNQKEAERLIKNFL
jgi:tRNA dimethylallyltransferase